MPEVKYDRSLGQKKRNAVYKFVRKVNQEIDFAQRPEATIGPDGQLIVYCVFATKSDAREEAVRKVMARASQQILSSDDIWVVGIPERLRVVTRQKSSR